MKEASTRMGTSIACATAMIAITAHVWFAPAARAEAPPSEEAAPKLFVDLLSSTRIYPNADAAAHFGGSGPRCEQPRSSHSRSGD